LETRRGGVDKNFFSRLKFARNLGLCAFSLICLRYKIHFFIFPCFSSSDYPASYLLKIWKDENEDGARKTNREAAAFEKSPALDGDRPARSISSSFSSTHQSSRGDERRKKDEKKSEIQVASTERFCQSRAFENSLDDRVYPGQRERSVVAKN
jgi:hypothetical protein